MAWLDTMDDWRWMLGNWDRVLEAAKVFPGDLFLLSRLAFLASGLHMKRPKGLCLHTAGGQSTEQRLHGILNQRAEHLFCTPTYAMRLTSYAVEAGIDLSVHKLKSIIVAGETVEA